MYSKCDYFSVATSKNEQTKAYFGLKFLCYIVSIDRYTLDSIF